MWGEVDGSHMKRGEYLKGKNGNSEENQGLSIFKEQVEEEDRIKETKLNVKRCIRNTVECSFMTAHGGDCLNIGQGLVT